MNDAPAPDHNNSCVLRPLWPECRLYGANRTRYARRGFFAILTQSGNDALLGALLPRVISDSIRCNFEQRSLLHRPSGCGVRRNAKCQLVPPLRVNPPATAIRRSRASASSPAGSPRRRRGGIPDGSGGGRACNCLRTAYAWHGLLRSSSMRSRFALHARLRRGPAPRLAATLGSSLD